MSVLVCDNTGEKYFETGVDHGVLYPWDATQNAYANGVVWNGLTGVTNSPDGAEPTDLWADNIKYGTLRAAEKFGGTIEAYTYPDEWEECDGSKTPVSGVSIGQQVRKTFGLCYRTEIGTDTDAEAGYKIHVVYGATAKPSSRDHETINESPAATAMSWEFDTIPAPFSAAGSYSTFKPTAHVVIDSTVVGSSKMASIEEVLYGGTSSAYLPLPDALLSIIAAS